MRSVALAEAIRIVGGVTEMARLLGTTVPAVSQWRKPPALRAKRISELTGVPLWDLRPDVFPEEMPASRPQKPQAKKAK